MWWLTMEPGKISLLVNIFGQLVSTASLVFGVGVFFYNSRKQRTRETLNYWEAINQDLKNNKRDLERNYGVRISHDQASEILQNKEEATQVNRLLNTYERLALRVHLKDFEIKTLNQLTGANFIAAYERFEKYIELRRKELNRPFAWAEFERLVIQLRDLRG